MDRVTVGLDIGTTSIKAVAVDGAGRVVARSRIPHELRVPSPDHLEHDAEAAWRRDPKRALKALGEVDAAAVGVTAMVPSLTAVDGRGRPFTPGLLYGDGRGRPTDPESPPGDGPTSGTEVMGFLRWTAAEAPGAAGYWPAQAVANRALGGRPAIDFSVAFIATPLFGAEGWDPELCAQAGAAPGQLPQVELPGAPVGYVGGRPGGPVLTAGSVDVWCEQLVSGAEEAGDVHVICGTTLIVWAVATTGATDGVHPGLWTVPTAAPDRQMVGGASNAGGMFLDWANRLTGLLPRTATRGGSPERRDLDAGDVPVWVPYLRGERTPYHDPERRAALCDLNLTHGPATVQRAAWEGSGFVVRHHLDLSGVAARRIVATGGGTKVEGWMQALADATGLPVHVAGEPEGAARGAAFLARMAAGLETDFSGASAWATTREVVQPDREWAAAAARRYRRFLDLSGPPEAGNPQ